MTATTGPSGPPANASAWGLCRHRYRWPASAVLPTSELPCFWYPDEHPDRSGHPYEPAPEADDDR